MGIPPEQEAIRAAHRAGDTIAPALVAWLRAVQCTHPFNIVILSGQREDRVVGTEALSLMLFFRDRALHTELDVKKKKKKSLSVCQSAAAVPTRAAWEPAEALQVLLCPTLRRILGFHANPGPPSRDLDAARFR